MEILVALVSLLVVKLYSNVSLDCRDVSPEAWFARGVCLSFLSVALHSANAPHLVLWPLFMVSAVLHLYAAYCTVEDRDHWTWLTIAFYPDENVVTRLLYRFVQVIKGDKHG